MLTVTLCFKYWKTCCFSCFLPEINKFKACSHVFILESYREDYSINLVCCIIYKYFLAAGLFYITEVIEDYTAISKSFFKWSNIVSKLNN